MSRRERTYAPMIAGIILVCIGGSPCLFGLFCLGIYAAPAVLVLLFWGLAILLTSIAFFLLRRWIRGQDQDQQEPRADARREDGQLSFDFRPPPRD